MKYSSFRESTVPLAWKVQTRTTLEQRMMPIKSEQFHTIKKNNMTTWELKGKE